MENSLKSWMSVWLLLHCSLIIGAQQGTNSGILVVTSSGGTVRTRLGCSEVFQCTGIGTSISWKPFGIRGDLMNSSELYIVEEAKPVETPAGSMGDFFEFQSRLIFPNVVLENGNSYTCTIKYGNTDSSPSTSVTVNLELELERTSITPLIENRDISAYYIGETLTVGCPVQTCSEGVTVQFVRGDQEVVVGTPSRTDETVYNMNLVLDEDSAATYTCMVRTEFPNDLVMQSFNITGTPMPSPTMPGVTSSPDDTTTQSPVTGTQTSTDTTQPTTTTSASVRSRIQLSVLVLLVIVASTFHLFHL